MRSRCAAATMPKMLPEMIKYLRAPISEELSLTNIAAKFISAIP
jgi:hypothetical protein